MKPTDERGTNRPAADIQEMGARRFGVTKDTRDKYKDEPSRPKSCGIPDISRSTLYRAQIFQGSLWG